MMQQNSLRTFSRFQILSGLLCLLVFAAPAFCQDRSADQGGIRGNRAEVAITIKEGSSQLTGPLVTVKLYYLGALTEQMTTSKGRVVFILNRLGDYTITADAVGYRPGQREISIPVAVEAEEEIVLQRDSAPEALGVAARPLLAPKAKEAMDRALQALNDNKLDEADKFLDITAKLAPNHPDVLYLQGVIFLRRNQSEKAQPVLEKATQIDPKNAHAFSALGMAFVNESRYTLAKAFYHQEQFDHALKESQLALAQSHGTEPAIELLLAQTQTAVGKYEDSAETLRNFLKNHPKDKGAATARRWLDRLAADGKIRKK